MGIFEINADSQVCFGYVHYMRIKEFIKTNSLCKYLQPFFIFIVHTFQLIELKIIIFLSQNNKPTWVI